MRIKNRGPTGLVMEMGRRPVTLIMRKPGVELICGG